MRLYEYEEVDIGFRHDTSDALDVSCWTLTLFYHGNLSLNTLAQDGMNVRSREGRAHKPQHDTI